MDKVEEDLYLLITQEGADLQLPKGARVVSLVQIRKTRPRLLEIKVAVPKGAKLVIGDPRYLLSYEKILHSKPSMTYKV